VFVLQKPVKWAFQHHFELCLLSFVRSPVRTTLKTIPFAPTKPANNSPNSSAEMRSQFTSLNADIQQRATLNDLNNAITNALQQTSTNSNGVSTLGQGAEGGYNQSQM
jgi:hypothetical protein